MAGDLDRAFENIWSSNFSSLSQQLSQSSQPFRPGPALPSSARTCAVPPPPTDIENLHLSQAFRSTSSSSQPVPDSERLDSSSNTEVLVSSQFESASGDNVKTKDYNVARSRPAVFKVPHSKARPVAMVSRQETAVNAANVHRREAPVDANGQYQADSSVGLNATRVVGHDNQNSSQKPTASEDNRSVVVNSPQSQAMFAGVYDSATATPFPQARAIHSTANVRHHVGDTPLALSGLTTR